MFHIHITPAGRVLQQAGAKRLVAKTPFPPMSIIQQQTNSKPSSPLSLGVLLLGKRGIGYITNSAKYL